MIKGGYYIKARKIQESKIAHASPCVREIWDWILKEANHKDTKVCKRGQCVRTYKDIQEGLKWYAGWRKMTYKKYDCENTVKWLKKATMITTRKTTRGMLITVLNYGKYQNPKNYENYKETTRTTTRKLQSTDTINKNVKETIKNVKNTTTMQSKIADKVSKLNNKPTNESSKVNDVLKQFYDTVNPGINFANKTNRNSANWLIRKYGVEKTLELCQISVAIHGEKYAPTITTPYQLKEKLGELSAFIKRQKSKKGFATKI